MLSDSNKTIDSLRERIKSVENSNSNHHGNEHHTDDIRRRDEEMVGSARGATSDRSPLIERRIPLEPHVKIIDQPRGERKSSAERHASGERYEREKSGASHRNNKVCNLPSKGLGVNETNRLNKMFFFCKYVLFLAQELSKKADARYDARKASSSSSEGGTYNISEYINSTNFKLIKFLNIFFLRFS